MPVDGLGQMDTGAFGELLAGGSIGTVVAATGTTIVLARQGGPF